MRMSDHLLAMGIVAVGFRVEPGGCGPISCFPQITHTGVVNEPGDGVVADPVDRPCIAHRDGRIEPTAV
jgi:hypothetical protein